MAAANDAATARVLTFHGPERAPANEASRVRIWLGGFTGRPGSIGSPRIVEPLDNVRDEIGATFVSFADQLASAGFSLLHRHMQAGDVGPVLVATDASQVIGAIGPMETMRDSAGVNRLLPPYFGVLPEYRPQGYGLALWRAAMEWARSSGADYLVLQAKTGSPPTASISPKVCARLATFARRVSSSRLRARSSALHSRPNPG